ncbi:MAG: exodeoxyribonuclease VII small subunit [Oscillospiraceae bacterium]
MQFEDSIKKIEDILAKLEGGNLPLDDVLQLYNEGKVLTEACQKQLDEAKLKVTYCSDGGENDTSK